MTLLRPILLFLFLISTLSSFAAAGNKTALESAAATMQEQTSKQEHYAVLPIRDFLPQQIRSRTIPDLIIGAPAAPPPCIISSGVTPLRVNRIWRYASRPPLFLLHHLFLFYD